MASEVSHLLDCDVIREVSRRTERELVEGNRSSVHQDFRDLGYGSITCLTCSENLLTELATTVLSKATVCLLAVSSCSC